MGDPSQKSENTATVVVTVDRNKEDPKFVDPNTYEKTIVETVQGGSEVLRVRVKDDDTVVGHIQQSNFYTLFYALSGF